MVASVLADVARVASRLGRASQPPGQHPPPTGSPDAVTDAVELSAAALAERRPPESAPIRDALVARLRAAIAAGTYLTQGKLDGAVERMAADLRGEA